MLYPPAYAISKISYLICFWEAKIFFKKPVFGENEKRPKPRNKSQEKTHFLHSIFTVCSCLQPKQTIMQNWPQIVQNFWLFNRKSTIFLAGKFQNMSSWSNSCTVVRPLKSWISFFLQT